MNIASKNKWSLGSNMRLYMANKWVLQVFMLSVLFLNIATGRVAMMPVAYAEGTMPVQADKSYLQKIEGINFIDQQRDVNQALKLAKIKPASDKGAIQQDIVLNKHVTIEQKAYADYEQSMHYLEQGRVAEAQDMLRNALVHSAHFDDARQTLVRLLIERGRSNEALSVLKKGVEISPANLVFVKGLARMQLGANEVGTALDTLNKSVAYADNDAPYHVLLATALQKINHHEQAIWHYKHALNLGGVQPIWLIGLGVSLEANGQRDAAKTVFLKAASGRLNPTLAHYVSSKLKYLQ